MTSYLFSIMHYGLDVVGCTERFEWMRQGPKPSSHFFTNILHDNDELGISVGVLMFVIQADGVAELMQEESIL